MRTRCKCAVFHRWQSGSENAVNETIVKETSAVNLALEVRDILKGFDVRVADIYTITTDNGSNVVACTANLPIFQERATEQHLASCGEGTLDLDVLNQGAQGQSLHSLHPIRCCCHVCNWLLAIFCLQV